jgi:hypothetical protein
MSASIRHRNPSREGELFSSGERVTAASRCDAPLIVAAYFKQKLHREFGTTVWACNSKS